MRYTFPEAVRPKAPEARLALDDVTFVAFREYEDSESHEICLTTHLLAFVLQGEKRIRDLTRDWRFPAGHGMFLRQNHYVMGNACPAPGEPFLNFVFLLGDAYLSGFVERHGDALEKHPLKPARDVCGFVIPPLLRASIESVAPFFQFPQKHPAALLRLKLDEILLQVLLADHTGELWSSLRASARPLPVSDLGAFLEQHYAKPWPLETFAAQSRRSLSKFKKDFRALFPEDSPKDWINRKRLDRAAFLIQHRDWPITEIAYVAGFENLSYFIQRFKQTFGVTPKQWQLNGKQQKKNRV